MSVLMLLATALSVGIFSAMVTGWLTRPHTAFRILDVPNARSLHCVAVPRTGGMAMVTALVAGGICMQFLADWPFIIGPIAGSALLLTAISFLDDWRGVRRRYRLFAQLFAASILVFSGLGIEHVEIGGYWLSLPMVVGIGLTLVGTLWMTNLYNFMDGMDGLAASMAVIGFGALAVLGWQNAATAFAAISMLIAATSVGFLIWNIPPARIFMGDSGSITLGYLAAALSLWGLQQQLFPLWTPLLIFSPFIVDATLTLLRRLIRGERIWEAHRSHYYQRLATAYNNQRLILLRAYPLMLACAICAVTGSRLPAIEQNFLLITWGIIYTLLIWRIELLLQPTSPDQL